MSTTKNNVTRKDVTDALYACIEHAPAAHKIALCNALEMYALRYGNTYRRLQHGAPFFADVLSTMEQASDAMIGYDENC